MLIKQAPDLPYSDVTPKSLYINRRRFLAGVPAAFAAGAWLLSPSCRAIAGTTKLTTVKSPLSTTGEKITPEEYTSNYNNYLEFGTDKYEPAGLAKALKTSPWTVSVEGDVAKPHKFSIEELMALAPLEERVYRHRCVEGWSIVVPWIGYSLSKLLDVVQPTRNARFVAFETLYDPNHMVSLYQIGIPLPYVDGLRLDEAEHPLALLCFGMYGETLPPQDGAPVRMVLPWKYGFKSIKSIVKIRLVELQPLCSYNHMAPDEYGFYANVNPNVDHPRWSQKTERRPDERSKRDTLMFNGYGDQVASLYAGMNLRANF
jgi:sulfoxide reductase catalytic subunit YedY